MFGAIGSPWISTRAWFGCEPPCLPSRQSPPEASGNNVVSALGFQYPNQASEAVNQAEKLGADIEKAIRTQQPFDWSLSRTAGVNAWM